MSYCSASSNKKKVGEAEEVSFLKLASKQYSTWVASTPVVCGDRAAGISASSFQLCVSFDLRLLSIWRMGLP